MYALILEDHQAQRPDVARHVHRAHLDQAIARPFDPAEAEEYDRERWGLSPDAIAAAAAKDAIFGAVTYGEPA